MNDYQNQKMKQKMMFIIIIIGVIALITGILIFTNTNKIEANSTNQNTKKRNIKDTNVDNSSKKEDSKDEQNEEDVLEKGLTYEEFSAIVEKYNLGLKTYNNYSNGKQHTYYATGDGIGDFVYSVEPYKADTSLTAFKHDIRDSHSFDMGNVLTDDENRFETQFDENNTYYYAEYRNNIIVHAFTRIQYKEQVKAMLIELLNSNK